MSKDTAINDALYRKIIDIYLECENIRETAKRVNTSVVKVRKVLITEGLWASTTSLLVQRYLQEGHTTRQIADILCTTEKAVQQYLPYTRGFYGAQKTDNAVYSAAYRQRIRLLQQKVLQKIKEENTVSVKEKAGKEPCNGVIRLHLSLESEFLDAEDIAVLKAYGGVKGERICRDILIPEDLPLYALHYVIQKLFGWQNSHLHCFSLGEEAFLRVTENRTENWMNLLGVLFRSPLMKDEDRFLHDDYEKGSFKNWLKKKYTGPYSRIYPGEERTDCSFDSDRLCDLYRNVEVSYLRSQDGTERICNAVGTGQKQAGKITASEKRLGVTRKEIYAIKDTPAEALTFLFEEGADNLLERLQVKDILVLDQEERERTSSLFPVTDTLHYAYDFGDSWKITITGRKEADDLVKERKITAKKLEEAIQKVKDTYAPVCIYADGGNVMDDPGGIPGYIEFLKTIQDTEDPENESLLAWAKWQGWTGRKPKAGNIL